MSEDEVFRANRPALAVRVRNYLNRYVLNHSQSLATHQAKVQHPWLDSYFKYSSVLGTHTFFMLFLPLVYQIGGDSVGRILILTSALAVYITAFIKDFFCVPRPASPPVRRLVIGTHHLEYGFPSTHSANSVGMAIFFYYLVEMARPYVLAVFSDDHPMFTYWFAETYLMEGLILLYAWTIVYGRLYSGMHSALDCFAGCCIGVSVALFAIWIDPKLGDFLLDQNFYVPVVIFGAACLSLAIHIPPVGPCPCYEDAVAFVGAWTGVCLGNWRTNSDYYADMAVMDATFRWITSWMPMSAQATCQSLWFQAVSHDYLKLLANLSFGIVPIVLFKVIASSPIKKAFPAMYMAVVRHLRKSQVQLRPVPAAAESAASGRDVETKGQLRRRPNAGKDTAASSPKSNDLHISTWASVDEKVCVDGPRLLIYTGIGLIGAWPSILLIDYFRVRMIELVKIS